MLQIHNEAAFDAIRARADVNGSRKELEEKLRYLHCYDSISGDPTRIKIDLYPGKDLYCDLTWTRKSTDGTYAHWMNGALVHHESDNSWSVHT